MILDLQEEAGSSPQTFNSDLTVEITVQKPEVEWMLFETTRSRKWMLYEVLIPYVNAFLELLICFLWLLYLHTTYLSCTLFWVGFTLKYLEIRLKFLS